MANDGHIAAAAPIALSVIVPAYNVEATIERAVNSALAWDGDDMELIVVDDGSTDGTAALVDDLAAEDSRVRVIHQENMGRSIARNVGVTAAVGKWTMFLDADDYLFADALLSVRAAMCCEAVLVVFPPIRSDCGGNVGYSKVPWDGQGPVRKDMTVGVEDLLGYMLAPQSATEAVAEALEIYVTNSSWARLYRRELLCSVAGRADWHGPFPPGVRFSEDRLMNIAYLAAAAHGTVFLSGCPLYFWDMTVSMTSAVSCPDDVSGLPLYRNAVDELVDCGLLATEEHAGVLAREVENQMAKIGLLPAGSISQACSCWRQVFHEDDIRSCLRARKYDGVRQWLCCGIPCCLLSHNLVSPAILYVWLFARLRNALKAVLHR